MKLSIIGAENAGMGGIEIIFPDPDLDSDLPIRIRDRYRSLTEKLLKSEQFCKLIM